MNESVCRFNPAYRVVDLINVVSKLRITAVVHIVVIIIPLNTWKSGFLDSSEPNLRRVSQAETIRDLSTKPAAEAEESLINERGRKNVIVADAGVARALGSVGAENGAQLGSAARIGIVVIETAGDAVLVGEAVVDFDVIEVRGGARKRSIDYVLSEPAVCWWQQTEDVGHYFTGCEIWIVGQVVTGNGCMRGGVVDLVRNVVIFVPVVADAVGREPGLANLGEVALAKIFVRKTILIGATIPEPESFVRKEEEGLVFSVIDLRDPNRPANSGSEVVLRIHNPF